MTKKEKKTFDSAFDMENILDLITIDHLGKPYKTWLAFIHACNFISAYYYASQASFRYTDYRDFSGAPWKVIEGNFIEVVYFIDIIIHFFLDYRHSVISKQSTRDLSAIIPRYIKGQLIWDLLPTLPLQFLNLRRNQ
jgi:hypothetical protein